MKHRSAVARLTVLAALCLVVFGGLAASAQAAAPRLRLVSRAPDAVKVGDFIQIFLVAENVGDAPLSGDITVTNRFPAGLTPTYGEVYDSDEATSSPSSCELTGQEFTCTVTVEGFVPGGQVRVAMYPEVESSASGVMHDEFSLEGGGTSQIIENGLDINVGPPPPFALEELESFADNGDGDPLTAAASTPYAMTSGVEVPTYAGRIAFFPLVIPSEQIRNIVAHVPPGVVGNPLITPKQCTAAELAVPDPEAPHGEIPACPKSSQVGFIQIFKSDLVPVYNMEHGPEVPALFGLAYQGVPIMLEAKLRPDDYGIDLVTRNTSTTVTIPGASATFWGVPAAARNDSRRHLCLDGYFGANGGPFGMDCTAGTEPRAFLRLPTSCTGPLHWSAEIDSYQHPDQYVGGEETTPAQDGCEQVPFEPTLSVSPTTNAADSPTGLEFDLSIPQDSLDDPEVIHQSDLRSAALTLPEGMTLNPAAASGLEGCTSAEIDIDTSAPANCPTASRIGDVTIETPLLEEELQGSVYLAAQGDNPFGSLFATYIVAEGSGVVLKLPGRVDLDSDSGRITATFVDQPQQPFSHLSLKLFSGPRAPLRTPSACGTYAAVVELTPWSGNAPVKSEQPFTVSGGPGGGSCAPSSAARPFSPGFDAGTLNPLAASYSPFLMRLTREDGSKEINSLRATLPPGLLARLAGVSYCPDAALAAISTEPGSGAAEMAAPSCPDSSLVGHLTVGAGSGPEPFFTETGRAYLAGPYNGEPYSLAVVVPAVAGPFDLGTVVVRNAIHLDPATTAITAISDPLPTVLHGVVLDLRDIRLNLDRNEFTLNPTSCDPMAVTGAIGGIEGVSAPVSRQFQIAGCDRLGFKPRLSLRLKGKVHRRAHPKLIATLIARPGDANIARAQVKLPASALLDQAHIGTVCTRVQFSADQCPPASIYGKVTATTPLLGYPLAGSVYLRSSSHKLPDLVVALRGTYGEQIKVELAGRTDSVQGALRNTFDVVPDAPVSSFRLELFGGKRGLIEMGEGFCAHPRATVKLDAQNGKVRDSFKPVRANCPEGRRRHPQRG